MDGPLDDRAFAKLAEEYAARLYAVARRMLGDASDAEDAVQRTLMKCYAARASYSPQFAVSTWLYRALSNVCIDELRKRKLRSHVDVASRELAGSGTSGPGHAVDLERALAQVPREARLLLALHYGDGLSHRELAAVRGISVNTVKSQLARGKAILRRALDGKEASRGSR